MHEIHIAVHPRLHLGLISMHKDAPRVNGGVGFAIEEPTALIAARRSDQFSFCDNRSKPMAAEEQLDLCNVLKEFAAQRGLSSAVSLQITGEMRTHVGMGSATGIRLGALECLALLNEIEFSNDDLIAASGRGGTSGVGISTYFRGGLVCDLGRRNYGNRFAPSSRVRPTSAPLTLPILHIDRWPMFLVLPRFAVPKTQIEEVEFFERTTPLLQDDSFEASYVALFEIYAAIADRDYQTFCQGVNHMQTTGWKSAERAEYGPPLQVLGERLMTAGADCVGMSSLGPMLFCFVRSEKIPSFVKHSERLDCELHQTVPRNEGRSVRHVCAS